MVRRRTRLVGHAVTSIRAGGRERVSGPGRKLERERGYAVMGYNINFSEILPFLPLLLKGLLLSGAVTIASAGIGTSLGLFCAVARSSGIKPLRAVVNVYVEVIRNTPLLVQMYLVYFGLGQFGLHIPPIPAAIIAMTLNNGAYTAVIFEAGIKAVDPGQREAALALGLTGAQTFRHIILPPAFRIVFAPLVNQTISLFLFSAVASSISVPELTNQALYVDSIKWRTFEVFILTTVLYFACSFVVTTLANHYERRRLTH